MSFDAGPKPSVPHNFANFFLRLVFMISATDSEELLHSGGKTSMSARHMGPLGAPPPLGRPNLNRSFPLASQITRAQ